MIKNSHQNDLCLLILLPVNNAAITYCNQIESSLTCQIQMNVNQIQKGLICTCRKQQINMKMYENEQNNNNNSLLTSLKNLTIEKRQKKISKDCIQQRRVKINKKFLSSSSSSPMTDINIPHRFSLWYSNKKKNIADGHDDIIK